MSAGPMRCLELYDRDSIKIKKIEGMHLSIHGLFPALVLLQILAEPLTASEVHSFLNRVE